MDITYLAVLLSCCGGYCLTRAKAGYMVICMALYITASSIWVYYSYTNAIYSLMINALIYITIELFGLYKWYKQWRFERHVQTGIDQAGRGELITYAEVKRNVTRRKRTNVQKKDIPSSNEGIDPSESC